MPHSDQSKAEPTRQNKATEQIQNEEREEIGNSKKHMRKHKQVHMFCIPFNVLVIHAKRILKHSITHTQMSHTM